MGISIWQLLIILLVVVVLFGTKKLRNMGSDLGEAVKGFKKGVKEDDTAAQKPRTIEASDTADAAPGAEATAESPTSEAHNKGS